LIFGSGNLPIKERMAEESNLSLEDLDQLLGTDSEKASASELDALTQDLLGGDAGATSSGLDQDQLNTIADFLSSASPPAPSADRMSFAGPQTEDMGGDQTSKNFPLLLDVNVRFIVELGRTQMYIKDVMLLAEGSIVELDKNVGDDVDILINDRLFGRGRLVVVDEFYAVQITQILNPMTAYRNL
jgi:flagellar motor switch protein FliN/FliY